jgi:ABC-type amino acid transport substrate-binding protein
MTLLSCLGSPSATYDSVKFLSSWLHLPPSVFDLYVETSAVTRFGQVLLSVAGFAFITLVIPLLYFGKAQFRPVRFVAAIASCAVLCAGLVAGALSFRRALFPVRSNTYASLKLDSQLTEGMRWKIVPAQAVADRASADTDDPSVSSIRKRGVLRVGFNPEAGPFSYTNAKGDLVGFDIAFSFRLARDLGVGLEFVPFSWPNLTRDLYDHRFDIAVSGVYETEETLQSLILSPAYYQTRLALLVPSRRAWSFVDRAGDAFHPGLKFAVSGNPILLSLSRKAFPEAQFVPVANYNEVPTMMLRIDGAVWTIDQATAWSAEHSGFTAVTPAGMGFVIPVAYAMAPDATELSAYVDQWLQLRIDDGFRDEQADYWMQLHPVQRSAARWNLLDYLRAKHRPGTRADN